MSDLVIHSLEMAAERTGDITPEVYRRYYEFSSQAQTLMKHVDMYMQGRMMEEVLGLLMTATDELPTHYLKFETANHAAYGVAPELYRPLFDAVRDTIRAAAGDDWSDAIEAAWGERIRALEAHILAAAPSPPAFAAAR